MESMTYSLPQLLSTFKENDSIYPAWFWDAPARLLQYYDFALQSGVTIGILINASEFNWTLSMSGI